MTLTFRRQSRKATPAGGWGQIWGMFKRILIANRGEIACRIIKTARRMGIKSVAVYSDADKDALHVEMADEAVPIGPAPAAQSYLDMEKILSACRKTGAQAVHPGYGFLSERESFARALEAAGIVFIGPNPAAIAAMGDKIESKKAAARAMVSILPGFLGVIAGETQAVKIATEIGYPVMLKASAGGGGKGMRVARNAREVREGLARARSEAKSSFGDDRIFIEKFIVQSRHIEIQVLGDKHGQVIHLGERECSVQRRNQKVIEESPSPLLDAPTRAKMAAQAVALAKAVGYDSAGTVEFVASQEKHFYFLEMNTRLQVEHPVTEIVTGIDLVEQMIRVAAGQRLGIKQADVTLSGWAVESRIYAEDPLRNFLPSTGRLAKYRPPPEETQNGGTLRIDTGVFEGGEISIWYDPLMAKLITGGANRELAIEAQGKALDAFVIRGIRHNISFLSAIMQQARFREGRLSTGFLDEEFPGGFHGLKPKGKTVRILVAVATALDHVLGERKRQISGQMLGRAVTREARRCVNLAGTEQRVAVAREGGYIKVGFLNGDAARGRGCVLQSAWKPGDLLWTGTVNGERIAVQVDPMPNGFVLAHRGVQAAALVYTEREAAAARLMLVRTTADAGRMLRCPMPGLIVSIAVTEGQEVKAGETLAVVEAMKMENVLRAERDGVIAKIMAKPGDSLAVDAVILEFV
jgi:propionyl-CoA carboxylase alpha chain